MKHVHFLIYRVSNEEEIPDRWDQPDGGLVMRPKQICSGVAVADFGLAEEVASHRYHRAPWEQLILVEVLEEHEKMRARRLHKRYERDYYEFLDLMNVEQQP